MTSLNDAFGIASFISGHDFGELASEQKQQSRSTFIKPQQEAPVQAQAPEPAAAEYESVPLPPSIPSSLSPKKKNLWKLVSYSFMVLLAILIYSTVEFWLRDLVTSNDMTSQQELGIRLLLPVVVFFILWNF